MEQFVAKKYRKCQQEARERILDTLAPLEELTGDEESDTSIQHRNDNVTRANNKLVEKALSLDGRRYKNELIEHNMRWAAMIAREYQGHGVELDDLMSEACDGLREAVERFDPSRNVRLTHYSKAWIRKSLNRSRAWAGSSIRIPLPKMEQLLKVRKTRRRLERKLGEEPTEEDVAAGLEISVEELRELMKFEDTIASLDAPIEDPGPDALTLGDQMESTFEQSSEKEMDMWMAHSGVNYVLSCLTPQMRAIIVMRHGLYTDKRATLVDTGKKLGLKRETVRLEQRKAEKILRASPEFKALRTDVLGVGVAEDGIEGVE